MPRKVNLTNTEGVTAHVVSGDGDIKLDVAHVGHHIAVYSGSDFAEAECETTDCGFYKYGELNSEDDLDIVVSATRIAHLRHLLETDRLVPVRVS